MLTIARARGEDEAGYYCAPWARSAQHTGGGTQASGAKPACPGCSLLLGPGLAQGKPCRALWSSSAVSFPRADVPGDLLLLWRPLSGFPARGAFVQPPYSSVSWGVLGPALGTTAQRWQARCCFLRLQRAELLEFTKP